MGSSGGGGGGCRTCKAWLQSPLRFFDFGLYKVNWIHRAKREFLNSHHTPPSPSSPHLASCRCRRTASPPSGRSSRDPGCHSRRGSTGRRRPLPSSTPRTRSRRGPTPSWPCCTGRGPSSCWGRSSSWRGRRGTGRGCSEYSYVILLWTKKCNDDGIWKCFLCRTPGDSSATLQLLGAFFNTFIWWMVFVLGSVS